MSDRIEDGGPAYPVPGDQPHPQMNGMSLRDWFAAHAPEPSESEIDRAYKLDKMRNPYNEPHKPKLRSDLEIRAAHRFAYADAMLAARKGGQS